MSASYNLVCEQATTFNFQFQIANDSTPWNLTNYTATMTVRPFIGATTSLIVATNTNGLIAIENFKMIPDAYKVTLSKKKFLHFQHTTKDLQYWVVMEKDSTV